MTTERARSLLLTSCLLSLAALGAQAQQRQRPMPPGIEDLPIGLAPHELRLLDQIGWNKSITAPPLGPVRAAAEWDESDGVFCLWDNASLMAELAQQNDVYVITTNPSWWQSWLSSNGIPTTNFRFLNAPTNTWWVRDYGPWFIWDGGQAFGLVDNIYNRPRPLDDVIPGAISNAYGVPYYGMDLIHTGGNYYADGYGTAWSSALVLQENPSKTKADVDQIFSDYLGVWRYVTPELNYDIEHFDTFGKLLAPDTLLWGSFPAGTTPWSWSEGALKAIEKLQSPYGWPYKVHRIPLFSVGSSWTAYVNSLMTQDKVVIPSYNPTFDSQAIAIYQAAAPGYTIAPVANGGTYWGDSVHCRTRNFVRGDALRVYPYPHWERTDEELAPYEVRAEVIPDNSTSLAGLPLIWWSVDGGVTFQSATMAATGNAHEYSGSIPAWPHGTTVSYYIEAQDLRGVTKTAPFVAPAALFTIEVGEDDRPPELEHTVVHGLDPADWPPEVTCTALDDTGIPRVTLETVINGTPQAPVTMTRDQGTFVFRATLPGSAVQGDKVRYRIVATDAATPANTLASPTTGWHWFVLEAAPRALVVDLDPTPESGEALVEACNDLGVAVEHSTSWPASLAGYDAVLVCLGMTPAKANLTTAQANALVSYLNAGGSAYLEGGDCWAQASVASIYRPWFGVGGYAAGTSLTTPLLGVAGEVTAGMSFTYAGEYSSSDHLTAAAGARTLLTGGGQGKLLAYSTGTYRTVASSFQFAGLTDGVSPTSRRYLAALLLDHLGLDVDLSVSADLIDPLKLTVDLEGEPGFMTAVFRAPAPGYQSFGPSGTLRLDRAQMTLVKAQAAPAGGRLRFVTTLPNNPSLYGTEVYFQAYQRLSGPSKFHLTNRNRVWIALP